ncbi:transmembrane channel-like protein 7 isoform X2 [Dreissena polymorpha]|uniref:transmembrane channel-like protein 7 isoform X2 n=1 Tax=Dreissena polymorpha TaxID=45954 RepID=UPI0022642F2D|nr:transmembrane channel-like protein 7 isoform X2 [Dreissena polymorpha]
MQNREDTVEMSDVESHISMVSLNGEEWHEQEPSSKRERRASLAASLTRLIIKGGNAPLKKASGLSFKELGNFDKHDSLEDMYLEEKLSSKRKHMTQNVNVRATMGYWKLFCHDLKVWHRRWKLKQKESELFDKYIKNMESNFGSAIGSLFVFIRWVVLLNFFLSLLWLGFVVLPMAVYFPYQDIQQRFAFRNLLDGKGVLEKLWLFFGSFKDKVSSYHLGLVYLLTCLVTYFGSFFVILGSVGQSQKGKSANKRYQFCLLLWSSWDHTITSREASVNLSKGITSALKDNLYEVKASLTVKERSRKEKLTVYFKRTLAWLITIILIGGGCSAIVYLVIFFSFDDIASQTSTGSKTDFLHVYGTTIIFSLINSLVPVCIQQLPKMENYTTGKQELNVTLFRVFFLRMANLFALIASLFKTVTKSESGCAGTILGQEMYKLVILDTLLHSIMQLIIQFSTFFWTKQKSEFNISSAVLVLVYRQALVWVGTIACPIMPVVGLLSSLVFMYVNYLIVSRTCRPPIKRWNQSRNTAFFSMLLLGSLIMLIPPVSIIIGSSEVINLGLTSRTGNYCGPWLGEKPTKTYTRFRAEQAQWVQAVLYYLVSEPVLIPLFMIFVNVTRMRSF